MAMESEMQNGNSRAKAQASEPDRHDLLKRSAVSASVAFFAIALLVGSEFASSAAASVRTSGSGELAAVDYDFVAQANLGASFQIESGETAEAKATTAAIRDYAHLMVVTHIPVVDALNKILQQKNIEAPPNTLLNGAYHAMVASLNAKNGAALDRDYVEGQVEYQKGNAALFRNEIENGYDPELKQFARATLPKIENHLQRALKLEKDEKADSNASQVRPVRP
jgi:putative membrane protein